MKRFFALLTGLCLTTFVIGCAGEDSASSSGNGTANGDGAHLGQAEQDTMDSTQDPQQPDSREGADQTPGTPEGGDESTETPAESNTSGGADDEPAPPDQPEGDKTDSKD